jgi:hypothetical protein
MSDIDWKQWMNQLDRLPADAHLTRSSMTEDDLKLESIWKCAFPDKLNHDEVLQLIHLMYIVDGEDRPMSMRSVAHHISVLMGVDYIYLLNEVYGVYDIQPDDAIQQWLKERLQSCGYYEWLDDDGYPVVEAKTIEELTPLLRQRRPCARMTLQRQPLHSFKGSSESETINHFLRSTLSLEESWQGIEWRELSTSIVLWDELTRVLQYNGDRSEQYMNEKEAHVFMGKIVELLTDFERTACEFSNHRANGIWYPVTGAKWQYWVVTLNSDSVGVFGIEE